MFLLPSFQSSIDSSVEGVDDQRFIQNGIHVERKVPAYFTAYMTKVQRILLCYKFFQIDFRNLIFNGLLRLFFRVLGNGTYVERSWGQLIGNNHLKARDADHWNL